MAFQAQQAPDYQRAAEQVGGMFARVGKAHLTWAQAKRDRDEKAAAIKIQRDRDAVAARNREQDRIQKGFSELADAVMTFKGMEIEQGRYEQGLAIKTEELGLKKRAQEFAESKQPSRVKEWEFRNNAMKAWQEIGGKTNEDFPTFPIYLAAITGQSAEHEGLTDSSLAGKLKKIREGGKHDFEEYQEKASTGEANVRADSSGRSRYTFGSPVRESAGAVSAQAVKKRLEQENIAKIAAEKREAEQKKINILTGEEGEFSEVGTLALEQQAKPEETTTAATLISEAQNAALLAERKEKLLLEEEKIAESKYKGMTEITPTTPKRQVPTTKAGLLPDTPQAAYLKEEQAKIDKKAAPIRDEIRVLRKDMREKLEAQKGHTDINVQKGYSASKRMLEIKLERAIAKKERELEKLLKTITTKFKTKMGTGRL